MDMLKKRLAIALTLALCVMPISAPLAFAETIPSVEVEETTPTPNEETTTEPSTDAEIITDIEETNVEEETETNEPEDIAENETGEAPEGTESVDEDLPPVLNENGEVISPGTLPDSPFYWLTTLIEKLQVVLTFDPVKKTELLEEQALERIAEAGALIEKGDTEEAEGALKAYTAKVAEAEAFVDQLTQTDSEIKQKLETALSTTQANNVQTLGGLLDKLPPQAAQRVAVNIVRSMEKSIAKMDKKEQQRVAKELKRATEDLEESELTEEEVVALENLDQVLEDGQLEEEAIAATPSAAFNTMALTTDSNRQSLVLDAKGKVTKAKSEANSEFEPTKQQAQKLKAKVEDKNQSKDVSNQKPE
ncbi:MAG: hypothetical protein HGJ97_04375, partial [Desulfosporosinus sp.]|nr:hypothetical protein [Desulfosporosinus sp.]